MTTPSHDSLAPSGRMSQKTFPRAYLLGLYTAALEHGHVYATPIKEADSVTLRQSFYRLRRRSDTSNSSFITPDMHLVTVGRWEPGPDGRGRLPILYTSAGDDHELPGIVTASGESVSATYTPPAPPALPDDLPQHLATIDFAPGELDIPAAGIDSFVDRMMKAAAERGDAQD